MIRLQRVYEAPSKQDGRRLLVERLWPRGLTKEKAAIDLWLKDLAPSTELRQWFGHDPAKWEAFRKRYRTELEQKGELLWQLKRQTSKGTVTFVYAAQDKDRNSAVVLKEYVEEL